jgi:hypothetical protein
MKVRIEVLAALSLAMLLGGCVTPIPTHVALSPGAQNAIASTEVVAPVRQSEIYVFVPATTAGANNGLIGALIDASVDAYRAGTAESGVKNLRNAVVDMNFDSAFSSQLKASLSQVAWLHLDGVRVIKEVTPKKIDAAITGSRDGAVLIAVADYHLSNDGHDLVMTANVDLYGNSAALAPFKPAKGNPATPSDPSNSLYRNTFTFESDLPGPRVKREISMATWTANNAAAFRSAMKLGEAKLVEMITADLQGLAAAPDTVVAQGTAQADGTVTFTAN